MLENKILLVDDEESILQTYGLLLEENGYHVVTANCGRKAILILSCWTFSCLEWTGYVLRRSSKQIRVYKRYPL